MTLYTKLYNIMPRRYKKRRGRKKRQFNRRTGPGLSKTFPLNKTFLFKTRYFDEDRINPGVAGLPDAHVYRLNSLFDPDFTGVGHQPIGFDQLMPMYDHYKVIGARVRVTFSNNDQSQAQKVLLQVKDTSALDLDFNTTIENGQSRWCVLASEGAGGNVKTLTINFSAKKFFNNIDGDKYQGTITTNPLEGAFLHVMGAPHEGTGDADIIKYNILIEYIAILTEPKTLTGS